MGGGTSFFLESNQPIPNALIIGKAMVTGTLNIEQIINGDSKRDATVAVGADLGCYALVDGTHKFLPKLKFKRELFKQDKDLKVLYNFEMLVGKYTSTTRFVVTKKRGTLERPFLNDLKSSDNVQVNIIGKDLLAIITVYIPSKDIRDPVIFTYKVYDNDVALSSTCTASGRLQQSTTTS